MSQVELIPLLSLQTHGACASLLRLEKYSLLLDCGWTPDFNPSYWEIVEPYVGEIHAILISNSELEYSGMLPMVSLHPLFTGAVYSTQPAHKLCQMALYDAYLARLSEGETAPLDIDKISRSFDQVQAVKYSQRATVKSQQHGEENLYLSAHCAGHAIGSAVWKINYNLQDIVYAPCFNPHESLALSGFDFASTAKPALMLVDAWHANSQSVPDASLRLCQLVRNTLNDGGNVLIPSSPSANVLDLLMVLENFWNSERDFLQNFSLVFLGHVSTPTVEFAKSNLEWMNPRIVSNFEASGENPFNFKYVKFARCEEDLPSPPFCVLASSASLTGLSKKLLVNLAESPHNIVVFTDSPQSGLPKLLAEGLKIGTVGMQQRSYFAEDKREYFSDQESTDVGETVALREETLKEDLHYSKLYEEKNFPCFAAFDVKGFVDEYGELMPEEETSLWRYESEDGLEEMSLLKTLSQSLLTKLFEEERKLKTSQIHTTQHEVRFALKREVLLCDGRADSTGLKLSIAKLRPKELILLNAREGEGLRDYCRDVLEIQEVHIAEDQVIRLRRHLRMQTVNLPEDFYNKLQFKQLHEFEVAFISGTLEDDMLQVAEQSHVPRDCFLGVLQLSKLKHQLLQKGYRVEQREGKLMVNEKVLISTKANDIVLEGVASDEYFSLRTLVYSNFLYI